MLYHWQYFPILIDERRASVSAVEWSVINEILGFVHRKKYDARAWYWESSISNQHLYEIVIVDVHIDIECWRMCVCVCECNLHGAYNCWVFDLSHLSFFIHATTTYIAGWRNQTHGLCGKRAEPSLLCCPSTALNTDTSHSELVWVWSSIYILPYNIKLAKLEVAIFNTPNLCKTLHVASHTAERGTT